MDRFNIKISNLLSAGHRPLLLLDGQPIEVCSLASVSPANETVSWLLDGTARA